MTDKEIQELIDLANKSLNVPITKEESLKRLIDAGILDKDGNYTENYPYLAEWEKKNKKKHE